MPRIVLQPAASSPAQANFDETVKNPVPLTRIKPWVDGEAWEELSEHYGGEAWVWGITPGPDNNSEFRQMSQDDIVLFYWKLEFHCMATVILTDPKNRDLAVELWGWENREKEVTWENVYFLTEPQSVEIGWDDLQTVTRHRPTDKLWRFTVLPQIKSKRVLEAFPLEGGGTRDPIQEGAAEGAEKSLESGQGFASSAEIRQAEEGHSMRRATEYFEDRGFEVKDVSANHPYDLRCEQGDLIIHVEVKGTQTEGRQVILTANEVQFAREHADRMVLFVVHSIDVSEDEDGNAEASGGTRKVYMPWEVDEGELAVINYRYGVPEA